MLDARARADQVEASIAILWRFMPVPSDDTLKALRELAAGTGYVLAPLGERFFLIEDATHLPAFNDAGHLGFTTGEALAFLSGSAAR